MKRLNHLSNSSELCNKLGYLMQSTLLTLFLELVAGSSSAERRH